MSDSANLYFLEVHDFLEGEVVEANSNGCNLYVENLQEVDPEEKEKKGGAERARAAAYMKDPPGKARKIIAGAIGEPNPVGRARQ